MAKRPKVKVKVRLPSTPVKVDDVVHEESKVEKDLGDGGPVLGSMDGTGTADDGTRMIPLPFMKKLLRRYGVRVLEELNKKDSYDFFREPVPTDLVPGYAEVITSPMDLGTVRKKLSRGDYRGVSALKRDLDLIWDNCCTFNEKKSEYYRKAVKLRAETVKLVGELEKTIATVDLVSEFGEIPIVMDDKKGKKKKKKSEKEKEKEKGNEEKNKVKDKDRKEDPSAKKKKKVLVDTKKLGSKSDVAVLPIEAGGSEKKKPKESKVGVVKVVLPKRKLDESLEINGGSTPAPSPKKKKKGSAKKVEGSDTPKAKAIVLEKEKSQSEKPPVLSDPKTSPLKASSGTPKRPQVEKKPLHEGMPTTSKSVEEILDENIPKSFVVEKEREYLVGASGRELDLDRVKELQKEAQSQFPLGNFWVSRGNSNRTITNDKTEANHSNALESFVDQSADAARLLLSHLINPREESERLVLDVVCSGKIAAERKECPHSSGDNKDENLEKSRNGERQRDHILQNNAALLAKLRRLRADCVMRDPSAELRTASGALAGLACLARSAPQGFLARAKDIARSSEQMIATKVRPPEDDADDESMEPLPENVSSDPEHIPMEVAAV